MGELLCFLDCHPIEHEVATVKKADGRVEKRCKACCDHPVIWPES